MKKFDILTCFPKYFELIQQVGVTRLAFANQMASLVTHDLRQYGQGNHKAIDDRPFGGSDGMVLTPEPVAQALETIQGIDQPETIIIYLTPQGQTLTQELLFKLHTTFNHYVLLCGRYAGVDQRVINYFQMKEISIGNYILSGGELPALVFIDGILRLLPGTLGNKDSVEKDSFSRADQQHLLEPPLYTRPREWRGQKVPEVLISGNHREIQEWNNQAALLVTKNKRPDLFDQIYLSIKQKQKLAEFIAKLSDNDRAALGLTQIRTNHLNPQKKGEESYEPK